MKLLGLTIGKKYKFYSTQAPITTYGSVEWPKLCTCCTRPIFRNPIPVAIGLVPIVTKDNLCGEIDPSNLTIYR